MDNLTLLVSTKSIGFNNSALIGDALTWMHSQQDNLWMKIRQLKMQDNYLKLSRDNFKYY